MSGNQRDAGVRAKLRMALQHILICCPDETVQKDVEGADDAVAELMAAIKGYQKALRGYDPQTASDRQMNLLSDAAWRLRKAQARCGDPK